MSYNQVQYQYGNIFNNYLIDTWHPDIIYGYGGDDTFRASDDDPYWYTQGPDYFHGGSGLDTITYHHADTPVWIDLSAGDAYRVAGDGSFFGWDILVSIERATGSSYGDFILGASGANILDGGGGNDTVHGWDGNDVLLGGSGHDWLEGGEGADVLYGGSNNDSLFGNDDNDQLLGEDGHDDLDGGDGNDTLSAGDGNDTLSGGDGTDSIYGGAGDDHAYAHDGGGTLSGDAGDDTLIGGNNADTILGGDDDDYLFGYGGSDRITGGEGDDTMDGGSGTDTAVFSSASLVLVNLETGAAWGATTGDDSLEWIENVETGSGGDSVIGSDISNRIETNGGHDHVEAGEGHDTIVGGSGNDSLDGEDGNDVISGGNHDDSLLGGAGSDTVSGGSGDDTIVGGGDNDLLAGGSGADVFRLGSTPSNAAVWNGGYDTITDFIVGVDKLQFEAGTLALDHPGGSISNVLVATDWGTGGAILSADLEHVGWTAIAFLEGVDATAVNLAIDSGSILHVEMTGLGGGGDFGELIV